MTNRTPLAALTILTGVLAVGCKSDPNTASRTAPNVTPDYAASHYNPAVNDTGSRTSTNDAAIRPNGTAETSTPMNTNMPMGTNGTRGTNVGGGTADQNGGSSSPTGTTGNGGSTGGR